MTDQNKPEDAKPDEESGVERVEPSAPIVKSGESGGPTELPHVDDPVSKYIPEFADVMVQISDSSGETRLVAPDRPVTIHHLLTHTGGLKVTGDDFWAVWNTHADHTTTTEFSRALAKLPLQSQPGEKFNYGVTGASYEVLAAVIEIASGETLEAFMQQNIFQPLGLHDTYFFLPDDKTERLPAFYGKGDDGLKGKGEASLFMVVPIVICAILSVLFGIYPDLFFNFFKLAGSIAASIVA